MTDGRTQQDTRFSLAWPQTPQGSWLWVLLLVTIALREASAIYQQVSIERTFRMKYDFWPTFFAVASTVFVCWVVLVAIRYVAHWLTSHWSLR